MLEDRRTIGLLQLSEACGGWNDSGSRHFLPLLFVVSDVGIDGLCTFPKISAAWSRK